MKYLLDSDTLIRAKNDFYSFDSVPGFWTWLAQLNNDGVVFSIDKVKQELLAEDDQLSNWVRMRGNYFFVKTDGSETQKALRTVAGWAYGLTQYTTAAQQAFFSKADFVLVGHALAESYTIVTFEKDAPNSQSSIKIPTACKALNVRCIDLFKLAKESPTKLVLS